ITTISPSLEQVVLTALEKDPYKRFANVVAFANALVQASQEGEKLPSVSSLSIPPTLATSPHESVSHSETTPPESSPLSAAISPSAINILKRGTLLSIYRGHSEPVSWVGWSPEGTRIAS